MRTTCGAVTATGAPCQNPPGCTVNHQTPAGTPPAAGPGTVPAASPSPDPLAGGGVVVPDGIRERIARLEAARAAASEAEDEGSSAAAEMWSYSCAFSVLLGLVRKPGSALTGPGPFPVGSSARSGTGKGSQFSTLVGVGAAATISP